MGFLGDIFGVVIDVVEVPIAVTKDVFTLGGVVMDEPEPYTFKKLKELKDDLKDL